MLISPQGDGVCVWAPKFANSPVGPISPAVVSCGASELGWWFSTDLVIHRYRHIILLQIRYKYYARTKRANLFCKVDSRDTDEADDRSRFSNIHGRRLFANWTKRNIVCDPFSFPLTRRGKATHEKLFLAPKTAWSAGVGSAFRSELHAVPMKQHEERERIWGWLDTFSSYFTIKRTALSNSSGMNFV